MLCNDQDDGPPPSKQEHQCRRRKRLLLLTLKRHRDGAWVTRLVDRLLKTRTVQVDVVDVEDFLHGQQQPTISEVLQGYDGVVNRVSDAATPVLFKLTVGILKAAQQLRRIPVWNGPSSYALCANKWCQHVLLQEAGLASPEPTRALFLGGNIDDDGAGCENDDNERFRNAIRATAESASAATCRNSCLVKPNSGGFGAGIVRVDCADDDGAVALPASLSLRSYADRIALIQPYVPTDAFHRVWFLNGRVQCAVVRRRRNKREKGSNDDGEFTSGCAAAAGGSAACRRRSAGISNNSISTDQVPDDTDNYTFENWEVPSEVEEEVLRIARLLEDAHAGSVEFLIDDNHQRLYFDVNLLSTLPLDPIPVGGGGKVEGCDAAMRDPWQELADEVVQVLLC